MAGKLYTGLELAQATELECFGCLERASTDPNVVTLPPGWGRETLNREQVPIRHRTRLYCPRCRKARES